MPQTAIPARVILLSRVRNARCCRGGQASRNAGRPVMARRISPKSCLLALLCFLALSACERPSGDSSIFRIGIESFPVNLDPRLAADAYSGDVIETLYNGLVAPADGGGYELDLASKIEAEGPLSYRITLRDGVRFHHGKMLGAEDVACTYKSVQDPATGSPVKASFESLEPVEVLSPLELRIRLNRPYAPFYETLTFPILPCDLLGNGHDFREQPVGTGFLRFVAKQPPSWVELAPFQDHFRGAPDLPTVRFINLANPTTRVLSLLRGELDLAVNNIPALYVDYLRKKGSVVIQQTPGVAFSYIGFNLKDPVLGNLNVREAIAHAINREDIVRYRQRGTADLANSILPASHWATPKDLSAWDYDPELSKKLLDEAGYPAPPDGSPRISLLYKTSQNKDRLRMIEVIRQQLARVGIEINVQPYEWGTFFDQIKRGDFQLYSLTWTGATDPDFYYNVFHSEEVPEKGGRNRGRYSNPEVDRLFEAGRTEMNIEKRAKIYQEAQRILMRDMPYLPLWHEKNIAVLSRKVEGYQLDALASFRALRMAHFAKSSAGEVPH